MNSIPDYLSDDILPNDTPAHAEVMTSKHPFICAEGPARTSKTMRMMRKLFGLHFKNPGFTSCVARVNAVDLNNTIRKLIRDEMIKYGFDDPLSQIKQQGGYTRFTNLYIKGGEMILGGLSRPGSIMGSKYDAVFLNELSQFTEDQVGMIQTRLSGDAWRDKDGNVIHQTMADSNSDVPGHWMYQYEKEGKIQFIKFNFTDNSYYYRQGRWSRTGKATVESLSRLPKFQRDRFFLGLRVAPTGIVYDLQPANIIDKLPDLDQCNIYRCFDWGMRHPSIVLWIAEHKETFDVYVIREWRRTHSDIDIVSDAAKSFSGDYEIETSIIDHNLDRQSLLNKRGIPSVLAPKGPGSVMDGVFLVQAALKRAQDGEQGGLYIYKDLLCNPNGDPHPDADDYPKDIIDEFGKLFFAETGDRPVDVGDDASDALRYFFLWRAHKWDLQGIPAILGKVNLYNSRDAII